MRCNGDTVLAFDVLTLTTLIQDSKDDYEQVLLADSDRAATFYVYTDLEAYVTKINQDEHWQLRLRA